MSLEFNADKQIITSSTPKIIGTEETTIRSGVGSDQKEVLRVQLDPDTQLPRVGINRTGRKVEKNESPKNIASASRMSSWRIKAFTYLLNVAFAITPKMGQKNRRSGNPFVHVHQLDSL